MASSSNPFPSSRTTMTRVFPSRRASSVTQPVAGLPALDAVGGGFDPVPYRVAHHMEEGLECLVLDRTVHACLVALHDDLDLPSFNPRRIVDHAREALKQAPDGHDPERLERVPDLEREPDQGITAVGHRGGRGVSRCGQDGQVVGLFLQPAELSGQVRLRDRRAAAGLRPFCHRLTSCTRSRLPSRRLRQSCTVAAKVFIDSACESQKRPCTISSEARSVSSSNRAAGTRIGPSAGGIVRS